MLLRYRGRWTAALIGLALPTAFAPFHLYPVALVLPALLFLLWEHQTRGEAAWRGFWFGFAAFAAGAYWLYISIRSIAGAPMPVAIILMVVGYGFMGLCLARKAFCVS